MTLYLHLVTSWLCKNCQTINREDETTCPECFSPREDGAEVKPEQCSCLEFVGDDLRCPVHGVNQPQ